MTSPWPLLAGCAMGATVILTIALLAATVWRGSSAAARHALLAAAFIALLALPLLALIPLPRWQAPVPVAVAVAAIPAISYEVPAAAAGVDWRAWTIALWALGALALLARFAAAHLATRRLIRRARVSGGIAWSEEISVPMAAGLWRPVTVLPEVARAWSAERLDAVLAHERAHIERRDPLTNAIAQLACALYWFHPLAWTGLRRLGLERERACDDRVLVTGILPSSYATLLLELARQAKPAQWRAALPMALRSQLEPRLRSILAADVPRTALGLRGRALIAGATAVLALPLSTMSGFESRSLAMNPRIALPFFAAALNAADLSGHVYDASSAVVPGATVVLRNAKSGAQLRASTGQTGEYAFQSLPAGGYDLEVLAPGFKRHARRGISLNENSHLTMNAILQIGEISESMVVEARGASKPRNASPQRIRVGGNVQATKLVHHVKPVYPESARADGREGHVTVQAVIGVKGDVINVRVMPGADKDLADAAEQAVKQWRYEPTLLNGQPIETLTTMDIAFRLTQ